MAPLSKPWTVELGTLWALETGESLPPPYRARVEVAFAEAGEADLPPLAAAMNLPTADPVRQRLHGMPGNRRRCFLLRAEGGTIAAYGWVTHGVESVGELERVFHLQRDEAYVWDCVTLPDWRGQGLYSALLSQIIYGLHGEGVPRIWIGASRHNRPSVRGIASAGFRHVTDCSYYRLLWLSLLWMQEPLSAPNRLVPHAYRIMTNAHERRVGRFLLGLHR
jgi:GNAT superfamily N-acetyltransferase